MRAVVQRVSRAAVSVDGEVVGAIGPGSCILVSVGCDDTGATAERLAQRVAGLRIHGDDQGRMNLDLQSAGGAVLVISQFTLHADTSRGHRPSFVRAASPDHARSLIDGFTAALRGYGLTVASGRFGAHMEVEIHNQGPVTIVLTSGEGPWEADAG